MDLPRFENGTELSALQVSVSPPRYIYANKDVLEWLKAELTARNSLGMPDVDVTPKWKW